MSKETIRPFVKITNKKHPHYGEEGMLLERDVPLSLSFLGKKDLIADTEGGKFFADREDYKIIN